MNRFFLVIIVAIAALLGLNQTTFAVCTEGPVDTFTCNTNAPNPDPNGVQQNGNNNNLTVNVLPGAAIDTALQPALDDDGIETGDGNNIISVVEGSVTAQDACIQTSQGNDQITITDSELASITSNGLNTRGGIDIIDITDSIVTTMNNDVITTTGEDDIVNVSGSEIKVLTADGSDFGISTGNENDILSIENSIIQGGRSDVGTATAISLGGGDDTITLGSGVVLQAVRGGGVISIGQISCASGFDTIIFAMDVPEENVTFISSQIASKNPSGDSIEINGLNYEWIDCELLVADLNGVPTVPRPIPTLSEWGLIAMAGIIGIAGLIFYRKRITT